jgi:tRNA nucleotidyltransferase (CCA-adding enzyme)
MTHDIKLELENTRILSRRQLTLLRDIASLSVSLQMPAYLVGGFVRDYFLKKQVNDLDVVIEGDAIMFGKALVKKLGGKLTPQTKFQTAIWHIPSTSAWSVQSLTLDLITARSETYSHSGALPTVKPSSIDDDLRRRDFTINAMVVRLDGDHFGELLDPLNGQSDLEQKSIRVLHPLSFVDDPTRIFRAIRYEQRYSFALHPSSLALINPESLAILQTLSGERIRHEFDLIFGEEKSAQMLARLHELGVFDAFEPGLPKFNEGYVNFLKLAPPAEFGILDDQVMVGWLLWLLDSPAEVVEFLARRLHFSSALSQACTSIIQLKKDLPALQESNPSVWAFHLEKIPPIAVFTLWRVSNNPALKEFLVNWRHIKPKTTGGDLKARGLAPGPRYTEILTKLRAAWLDGEVENDADEQALLDALL